MSMSKNLCHLDRVRKESERVLFRNHLSFAKRVSLEPSKYPLAVLQDAERRLFFAKVRSRRSARAQLTYDLRLSAIQIEIDRRG